MEITVVEEAIELLEKANSGLAPELLTRDAARRLLDDYTRARRLADFGIAQLARKLDDPGEIARTTGTSMGKAKETVTTGKVLGESHDLSAALKAGEISLDQAARIAVAEEAAPGSARDLIEVAKKGSFTVLTDAARRVKLDADQHHDLGARQRAARSARSHIDELGMIHINLALEPHIGTPIVNRAEAEASRLYRKANKDGTPEPFERHLADAYAALLAGAGTGKSRRPELVVLVSHGVVKRGWKDVKEGEVCKIPGIAPVSPEVARDVGRDAFLTGVFFDGTDLRHMKRWSRTPPVEVLLALELGEPPDFDGIKCTDCGNRFRTENDHVEPHVARGPASTGNLKPRCRPCHQAKTERDRKAGKLRPPGKRAPPNR
jgi:hypothetical protein